MKTYTMTEIAKKLKIPESTARYYRDRFADYVPAIGTGRSRRYPQQALDAIQLISTLMKENKSSEEVEKELEKRFGVTMEVSPEPQEQLATIQQQSIEPTLLLTLVSQQNAEVAILRKELEDLRNEIRNRDESRDQKLTEVLRLIQEQQKKKKPWWKRLFN